MKDPEIQKIKILIVDDESDALSLMEDLFRKNGYETFIAEHGLEALQILENNNDIEIIVSDLVMPEMDGLELLQEVRRVFPHLKFIITTAHGTVETAVEAIKSGADDYILKPIYIDELLHKCLQLVRMTRSEKLISQFAGRIFLSYTKADRATVDKFYNLLKLNGYNPWMDTKDILPGEKWEVRIEKAIKSASFFVACLSINSINKRGIFQKEIRIALEKAREFLDQDIYFIPVRFDNCDIPASFNKYHWIDFHDSNFFEMFSRSIRKGLLARIKVE